MWVYIVVVEGVVGQGQFGYIIVVEVGGFGVVEEIGGFQVKIWVFGVVFVVLVFDEWCGGVGMLVECGGQQCYVYCFVVVGIGCLVVDLVQYQQVFVVFVVEVYSFQWGVYVQCLECGGVDFGEMDQWGCGGC